MAKHPRKRGERLETEYDHKAESYLPDSVRHDPALSIKENLVDAAVGHIVGTGGNDLSSVVAQSQARRAALASAPKPTTLTAGVRPSYEQVVDYALKLEEQAPQLQALGQKWLTLLTLLVLKLGGMAVAPPCRLGDMPKFLRVTVGSHGETILELSSDVTPDDDGDVVDSDIISGSVFPAEGGLYAEAATEAAE